MHSVVYLLRGKGQVLPYCHLHPPDEVLDVWTPGGFPAIPGDTCVHGVYDRLDPVSSHWQTGIGCAKFSGMSPRRLGSALMALRLPDSQKNGFVKDRTVRLTHLYRFWAVEQIRRHESTVFGEGEGKLTGKLQAGEVVTNCDHLTLLAFGQLKDEIRPSMCW